MWVQEAVEAAAETPLVRGMLTPPSLAAHEAVPHVRQVSPQSSHLLCVCVCVCVCAAVRS